MRLIEVDAQNALSFASLSCPLNERLTLVTGPNACGKTSIGRIIEMINTALAETAAGGSRRMSRFGHAGRYGARTWSVRLHVELDDDELTLVDHWVRMSLMREAIPSQDGEAAQRRALLDATGDLGTVELFSRGWFHLDFDDQRITPWRIQWQSSVELSAPTDTTKGAAEPISKPVESDAAGAEHEAVAAPATPARAVLSLALDRNDLTSDIAGNARLQLTQLIRDRILEAQKQAETGSGPESPLPATARFPSIIALACSGGFSLAAAMSSSEPFADHPSAQAIIDFLHIDRSHPGRVVGFAQLAAAFMAKSIIITSNRRVAPRMAYGRERLTDEPDIGSGEGLALALFRDKNGDDQARTRFATTRRLFAELTGDTRLDVVAEPISEVGIDDQADAMIRLTPIVGDEHGDVPLELSGAGRQEAAWLAAVLARDIPCLVLDEPATNLSASAQKLLVEAIAARTAAGRQTVLITHSGHLVSANTVTDLTAVIRLVRTSDRTLVRRVTGRDIMSKQLDRLQPVEVRDALFAAGALLVEGKTEIALLREWLPRCEPTLSQANIALLTIDGDTSLIPYMSIMDELGVRWAAIVDGPAFERQLPHRRVDAPTAFDGAQLFWAQLGVFTLAKKFGTGDQKGEAEIEAWLAELDPQAWAEATSATARRMPDGTKARPSKPRAARWFAEHTPVPTEIEHLWDKVRAHISSTGD